MSSVLFSERLKTLYGPRGRSEFARKSGIPKSTLAEYEKGRQPRPDAVVAIASAAGVSPVWLLTGGAPKYSGVTDPTSVSTSKTSPKRAPNSNLVDQDVMGHIVDRIMRTYREVGAPLSPLELGRLSAEKYNEISALCADPDELPAHLDLMAIRLRKSIVSGGAEPRKREA